MYSICDNIALSGSIYFPTVTRATIAQYFRRHNNAKRYSKMV